MPKRHRVFWSGPALTDLREIQAYVAFDKPAVAKKVASRLRQSLSRVREHPQSGRLVPEFAPLGYREVIVAPYRVIYAVEESKVVVLRVWHGRRDLG